MVNIAAAVWSHAVTDPDRLAVRSPVAQTYGQLREASARVAGAVREAGLAPLDRVVLIAPSVPEFREALAELSAHLAEIRHNAH